MMMMMMMVMMMMMTMMMACYFSKSMICRFDYGEFRLT